MKCLLMLLLILFQSCLLQAQKHQPKNRFTLNGKMTGGENTFIHLSYYNEEGIYIRDSCRIFHGSFSFTGFIKEPVTAELYGNKRYRGDDSNKVDIYLEPSFMLIILKENEFKQAGITGSTT